MTEFFAARLRETFPPRKDVFAPKSIPHEKIAAVLVPLFARPTGAAPSEGAHRFGVVRGGFRDFSLPYQRTFASSLRCDHPSCHHTLEKWHFLAGSST